MKEYGPQESAGEEPEELSERDFSPEQQIYTHVIDLIKETFGDQCFLVEGVEGMEDVVMLDGMEPHQLEALEQLIYNNLFIPHWTGESTNRKIGDMSWEESSRLPHAKRHPGNLPEEIRPKDFYGRRTARVLLENFYPEYSDEEGYIEGNTGMRLLIEQDCKKSRQTFTVATEVIYSGKYTVNRMDRSSDLINRRFRKLNNPKELDKAIEAERQASVITARMMDALRQSRTYRS